MARGQAERLVPLLEALLAQAGLGWSDLAVIGVGTGPGNFTGVRVAVACARGLALGLGVPAVGVDGFTALGHGQAPPLLVSLPGPRGQVWLRAFSAGPEMARGPADGPSAGIRCAATFDAAGHSPAPGGDAWCGAPDDLPSALIGSGLAVTGAEGRNLAALTGGPLRERAMPQAVAIARIALLRRTQPVARPAPVYLRAADAAPPADPPPVLLP